MADTTDPRALGEELERLVDCFTATALPRPARAVAVAEAVAANLPAILDALRHRFASPQTAGGVGELVEKLRKWADSGDMGRSPDPSDLRRKAADTIASLTAERDAALVRCEGLEKLLRDKDMGDA